MKKVMKRKILLVIAAVLVLSLSVGFASAYFSDHEATQGSATIQLGGQSDIVENFDTDGTKHIKIKNTGDATKGDTEVVVRVAIYGPEGMKVTVGSNWTDKTKIDGYYYYNEILQPSKKTTTDLAAKVTVPEGMDLGDNFDIVVMQESAQPTYTYVNGRNKVVSPAGWNLPDIYASEEGGE